MEYRLFLPKLKAANMIATDGPSSAVSTPERCPMLLFAISPHIQNQDDFPGFGAPQTGLRINESQMKMRYANFARG